MLSSELYATVFNALGSGDIHHLVRTFAQLNEGPVFLADAGLNLISIFPEQPIHEKIFDELLRSRKLSDELTVECQKFYLSGTTDTYEPFYVDTDPDGTHNPRLLAEVCLNSKVYGHLVLYRDYREHREEDLEMVTLFAQAALIKLTQDSSAAYTAKEALEILLSHDPPRDSTALARSIEELLGSTTIMLVALIPGRTQDRSFAHYVLNTINEQYRDTIACKPGHHLVILRRLSPDEVDREVLLRRLEKLRSLLGKFELTIACTDPIIGCDHLRDHYELAKSTIKLDTDHEEAAIAHPDLAERSPVVFCSDHLPRQLFQQVVFSGKAGLFIPRILKRIYCDQASGGTLFESLRQYYLHFGDIDEAARKLNVHRNTLIYRLRRVQEIYGIDHKDVSIRQRMYVAFELIGSSGGKDGLWMG